MAATPKPARKAIKKMVKESHDLHAEKAHHHKQETKTRMKEHASRLKEAHHKGHPVLEKGKHVKALVNPKIVKRNEELHKERMAAHAHMKAHGG